MPVQTSYPGVYIEELPSGVRTITGVATAVAAFVGWARTDDEHPVNTPVTINNFGDYERAFGGLDAVEANPSVGPMYFAVQDYFFNGGSKAIVVPLNAGTAAAAQLGTGDSTFQLQARDAGIAGNALRASIAIDDKKIVSLSVSELVEQRKETYTLKVDDIAPKLAKSKLVELDGDAPTVLPEAADVTAFKSGDATKAAQASLGSKAAKRLKLKAKAVGEAGNLLRARIEAIDSESVQLSVWVENKETESHDLTLPKFADAIGLFTNVVLASDPPKSLPTTAIAEVSFTGGDSPAELTVGTQAEKTGMYALEQVDLFTLLCIPGLAHLDDNNYKAYVTAAAGYCTERRAMLILDAPKSWSSKTTAVEMMADPTANVGTSSTNAAIYFPRINRPNPLKKNAPEAFPACGAIAGLFARTDTQRGIWKAPAGTEAGLVGAVGPAISLTDAENGELNPLGCNCIRSLPPYGTVVWGGRTLKGNDELSSEWKYVPIRRLSLYIEESLFRGTQWVVFEPNDEPLWSQIRLNIGTFMHDLFRQGAFQGSSPKQAYFVKCDHETTTQSDIDSGRVNIIVGFAPLKPAEFVILKFQQIAGQV